MCLKEFAVVSVCPRMHDTIHQNSMKTNNNEYVEQNSETDKTMAHVMRGSEARK